MSLFYNASQAPCAFAGFYRARTEKKTLFIILDPLVFLAFLEKNSMLILRAFKL